MITLNSLIKKLHERLTARKEVSPATSPRAMSIRISRSWRRFDACHYSRPPLHLTTEFVEEQHSDDACPYIHEFSEREELAADIIIDAALALRQGGCKNIEQVIKDRIAWRMEHDED